jgi:hypothetical protein
MSLQAAVTADYYWIAKMKDSEDAGEATHRKDRYSEAFDSTKNAAK